jgi:hypothetical protein
MPEKSTRDWGNKEDEIWGWRSSQKQIWTETNKVG